MALSKQQVARLNSIIATAKKMITVAEKEPASNGPKRLRRSSADAAKMKDQIRAARAKGVSATKLAEKYGVSTAYDPARTGVYTRLQIMATWRP